MISVASGVVLGIRLRFHNHAPKEVAIGLAFHQQAANEVRGNLLGGAGEEAAGERWEGFYCLRLLWLWEWLLVPGCYSILLTPG